MEIMPRACSQLMSIVKQFKTNGTLSKRIRTTMTSGKMPLSLNTMTTFQLTNQENKPTTLMSGHASVPKKLFRVD